MPMKTEDLSYYLSLEYPMTLTENPDGGYFVVHPDLDGCMAEGETLEEAVAHLADARELWIETCLENGYPVPEPSASAGLDRHRELVEDERLQRAIRVVALRNAGRRMDEVPHPDQERWDLGRLAKSGAEEDLALAEQGLADLADVLDEEDHADGTS